MIGYFNTYINKYYRTPHKKTYTVLGLSLILIITFFIFAIRPTAFTVVELRQKLKEGQTANEALDAKIQTLHSAQEVYQRVMSDLPLLDLAVPQQGKMVSVLNQVNLLALQNELNVTELLFEGSSSQTGSVVEATQSKGQLQSFNTLVFRLSAQGGYEQMEKFVSYLQNLPRLVNLISVEIVREEGEEELTLNLQGEVYYRGEVVEEEAGIVGEGMEGVEGPGEVGKAPSE